MSTINTLIILIDPFKLLKNSRFKYYYCISVLNLVS